jgi:hypothetical protein
MEAGTAPDLIGKLLTIMGHQEVAATLPDFEGHLIN